MDTKIPSTFWTDPKFDQCDSGMLLAALWIKTNERLDLLGSAEISPRNFEFQTHLPFKDFGRACKPLGRGLVRDGNRYWIRDFVRQQIGAGDSLVKNHMRKALQRALSLIESEVIRSEILKEYPQLSEADGASPLEGATEPQEQSREEQRGEEQNRAEQSPGGAGETGPGGRRRSRGASSRPAEHPEPQRGRMIVVGEIMGRRAESAWSEPEKKALAAAGLVDQEESDFKEQTDVMRAFYRATIPEAKQREFWRRTTLPILLNNWPSELDKARKWQFQANGSGDGVTKVN